ncbi:MAG: hypothetical protein EA390_13630 [Balneolaceae bacterium]|nr:MAG: hypothetical protein EA390_13630 [Balneolaceae bacterium]
MIIFGMVITTSNRFMLGNTSIKVQSEVEVRATALAQDLIEYSKGLPFDAATENNSIPDNVPGDFVNGNPMPTTPAQNREQLQFFEDLNNYEEELSTNLGDFKISAAVEYMDPGDLSLTSTSKSIYKKLTVTVTNPSINNNVTLSYIRVYNNYN